MKVYAVHTIYLILPEGVNPRDVLHPDLKIIEGAYEVVNDAIQEEGVLWKLSYVTKVDLAWLVQSKILRPILKERK